MSATLMNRRNAGNLGPPSRFLDGDQAINNRHESSRSRHRGDEFEALVPGGLQRQAEGTRYPVDRMTLPDPLYSSPAMNVV